MTFELTNNNRSLKLVDYTEDEYDQVRLYFKRKADNYLFHPLYRKKIWDGTIAFFDDRNMTLSMGLWKELYDMCKQYDYQLKIKGLKEYLDFENFDEQEYRDWEKEYYSDFKDFEVRYYQTDTVISFLKWKRSIAELATSAGKTLIIYNLFAFLKMKGYLKGQFMVVVPNLSLVLQTLEAFTNFSKDKTKLKFNIQTIGGGENKIKEGTDVIIGTFQTLRTLSPVALSKVSVALIDESHSASSLSVKKVLDKCGNAVMRCGLSGTTMADKKSAGGFTMQAQLGPLVKKVTPSEIIDKKFATPVRIEQHILDYLDMDSRIALSKLGLNKNTDKSKILRLEKKIITTNPLRRDYIINLVKSLKENSLVLFQDVSGKYGKELQERLKDELPSDKYEVFYVSGEVSKELREEYRKRTNLTDKITIMIASFGTFSTGIDINNLHYIILAESYKSERLIKQSIGRGMRLMKGKLEVVIIDLIDDFRTNKWDNFIYKHGIARRAIYANESFPVTRKKIKLS